MSTLTLWSTLFCHLLKCKLCLRHHLVHLCDPGHCLALLGGTRSAGERRWKEKKWSSTQEVILCELYFPSWLIPSSWFWIPVVITSSSALTVLALIPWKTRAEFFFWNRNFIWCRKLYQLVYWFVLIGDVAQRVITLK